MKLFYADVLDDFSNDNPINFGTTTALPGATGDGGFSAFEGPAILDVFVALPNPKSSTATIVGVVVAFVLAVVLVLGGGCWFKRNYRRSDAKVVPPALTLCEHHINLTTLHDRALGRTERARIAGKNSGQE